LIKESSGVAAISTLGMEAAGTSR